MSYFVLSVRMFCRTGDLLSAGRLCLTLNYWSHSCGSCYWSNVWPPPRQVHSLFLLNMCLNVLPLLLPVFWVCLFLNQTSALRASMRSPSSVDWMSLWSSSTDRLEVSLNMQIFPLIYTLIDQHFTSVLYNISASSQCSLWVKTFILMFWIKPFCLTLF